MTLLCDRDRDQGRDWWREERERRGSRSWRGGGGDRGRHGRDSGDERRRGGSGGRRDKSMQKELLAVLKAVKHLKEKVHVRNTLGTH